MLIPVDYKVKCQDAQLYVLNSVSTINSSLNRINFFVISVSDLGETVSYIIYSLTLNLSNCGLQCVEQRCSL